MTLFPFLTIDFVQITATFYDSNKAILGSDFTFADPSTLRPLEGMTNIPANEIGSIKMHIGWN
jgi:hypothetical protein